MLLLIDNYDSFTFNLYQFLCELGAEVETVRNDAITLNDVAALAPEHIVISPGPCTPAEAGLSVQLVQRFGEQIPILGVCLGHQCIGAAYGAMVAGAGEIVHGKTSNVTHDGEGIFTGLPNPLEATRYHSLAIVRETLPPELSVTATSETGVIMGVRHVSHPVQGIQFHPESVLTEAGHDLLHNFLASKAPKGTAA